MNNDIAAWDRERKAREYFIDVFSPFSFTCVYINVFHPIWHAHACSSSIPNHILRFCLLLCVLFYVVLCVSFASASSSSSFVLIIFYTNKNRWFSLKIKWQQVSWHFGVGKCCRLLLINMLDPYRVIHKNHYIHRKFFDEHYFLV